MNFEIVNIKQTYFMSKNCKDQITYVFLCTSISNMIRLNDYTEIFFHIIWILYVQAKPPNKKQL